MKLIQAVIVLSACAFALAGCSSDNTSSTASTASGTIAPASATMTPAQSQARYMATVPAAVRKLNSEPEPGHLVGPAVR